MLKKSVRFPSDIKYLEQIERTSSQIAQEAGFDEDTIDDISIALTELVNNAIHHANQDDLSKNVHVSFYIEEKKHLKISIKDEGTGFTPSQVNDPLHPDNIMLDNGRGLYLVNALMDSVEYKISKTGTEVIIIKNL